MIKLIKNIKGIKLYTIQSDVNLIKKINGVMITTRCGDLNNNNFLVEDYKSIVYSEEMPKINFFGLTINNNNDFIEVS